MLSFSKSFLTAFLLLCSTAAVFAQMPPHPELLQKMKSGEIPNLMSDAEELRAKGIDAPWSEGIKLQKNNGEVQRMYGPAVAPTGRIKTLTILVQFPDQLAKTPAEYFDSILYNPNGSTVYNYYKEISNGKVEIVAADLPSKIGWVMAPKPYTYYVGTGKGQGDYPANSQGLTETVTKLVDSLVDFTQYDNDKDGSVEALFIVHTGPGSEFSGRPERDIWSHAWSVPGTHMLDGVRIRRYSIEPEYLTRAGDMTCGVFAHELGHALFGLPDLYDYGSGTDASEGIGNWSLMAGGSWNGNNGNVPAHPDAWTRIQMGLATAKNITANELGKTIADVKAGGDIYRIWKGSSVGSEYFLIENRQKTGYDAAIPGGGLLIYHIDDAIVGGRVNDNQWYPGRTTSGHYKVALLQADGRFDMEKNANRGDAGDPYPGGTLNRTLSFSSLPSSSAYSGTNNFLAVRNISNAGSTMSFDIDFTDYLDLSKTFIDFGVREVSGKSDTLSFNVINTSSVSTSVKSITNKNPQFKLYLGADMPKTLGPGESYTVKAQYFPSAAGSITDTIAILSGDAVKSPLNVTITGKGYAISQVSKTALYGSLASSSKGSIITINPATGVSSEIGSPGFSEFRALTINRLKDELTGLYSTAAVSKLARINASAGDAYEMLTTDSILVGIAYDKNNRLYGATSFGNILLIDQSTGKSTLAAKTGLTIQCIAIHPKSDYIFAGVGGNLDAVKDKVYKINKQNADTTYLGRTGFNVAMNGITFDAQGNCYGTRGTVLQIGNVFRVDTASGTGTQIGTIGFKGIRGIAMHPGAAVSSITKDMSTMAVTEYSLSRNYPNPFNPSTAINFQIPEAGMVELKVYNSIGQEVATLVNEFKQSGRYTVNFNASALSSGIYFYTLTSGSFVKTNKMILMK